MSDQSAFERMQQRLVAILAKLLAIKGWEDSPLLKVYKKRLLALQSKAEAFASSPEQKEASSREEELAVPAGHRLVYVSLFQADGSNLIKWEMAIRSLESLFLGRPIHDSETAAQKLIDSKPNKVREGYVVVRVKDSDILTVSPSRQLYDMQRQKLLIIKQNAISANNIVEFVHGNALHYRFVNNRLVLKRAD